LPIPLFSFIILFLQPTLIYLLFLNLIQLLVHSLMLFLNHRHLISIIMCNFENREFSSSIQHFIYFHWCINFI
jgi:hypothetical protein